MTEASGQASGPGREDRFSAYLSKLLDLKARNALREVTEREMLFEFIQLNHSRINEYPMLKTQQSSLINLLCHRSTEHPAHEYIKKVLATFLILLNRYGKAVEVADPGQIDLARSHLSNTEALLIKCIQGVVYSSSLTADNFEEIFIRYFGAEAIQHYNGFLESYEMDENFWRALIEFFILRRIGETYEEIIDNERYSILKNPANIVIRFQFDDVLAKLKHTAQDIKKTRVQTYFERNTKEYEYKRAQKFVFEFLKGVRRVFLGSDGTEDEVKYLSRIVGIDSAAMEFKDEMLSRLTGAPQSEEKAGGDPAPEVGEVKDEAEARIEFQRQQILALAVGASLGVGIVRQDFTKALGVYSPKEMEAITALIRFFDIPSLQRLLFYLLENSFVRYLTAKGEEEGGKVRVRTARQRRTSDRIIEALAAEGLNKIRRKRLWIPDPSRAGMSLFIPRTRKELAELLITFQFEPPLAAKLIQIWDAAPFKVEIMLVLDLVLISKATTNLKLRLSEILAKFGIGPRTMPTPMTA
jgi:hypothetical protein